MNSVQNGIFPASSTMLFNATINSRNARPLKIRPSPNLRGMVGLFLPILTHSQARGGARKMMASEFTDWNHDTGKSLVPAVAGLFHWPGLAGAMAVSVSVAAWVGRGRAWLLPRCAPWEWLALACAVLLAVAVSWRFPGAWDDQVAALAGVAPLGLTPLRRSMARIPAPGGLDVAGWPMIFGCGESWYAKPDAGALIVSPAEEDPAAPHDAWADDMVLAEGLARYEEMVTAPVTRMIANWAGLRTFAPDRVPVIGPDAAEPSFFWLAGQGGYGFQTSPAAAGLVADLLTGRAPAVGQALADRLSPRRFA